ncbi:AbrB family transcriptional regulator [Halobacterium noricense]|uniref:AbrB family transcriptional regulator n=1 Tax=Halobacterium noricense TaxID=223182 RepID=UPI001E4973C2|nr:AbrB family transcriptional regulator [Halobacterium noricense]UHH25562.1 AbrB family transcriptional regulator [Halobacterium noricense]
MVTIPAALRRRLDDRRQPIEVVQQRDGVFDDFEPVDVGETNAVDVEGEFGAADVRTNAA